MNALLKLAELLYRGTNRVRRDLYRRGVLKSKRLPRPVISVGNIAIGGSGKTPAVIAIARFLDSRQYRVAVLSRGYGRHDTVEGVLDELDPERWGDEPVVIKTHVPNADVIIGRDRYRNALQFLAQKSCDVFVLDDGFQHLQLARDLDIVIEAPSATWFREGSSALQSADVVLPRAIRPSGLEALRGHAVFAFAGLADNEQFFEMLRHAEIELTAVRAFPDHHRYSPLEMEAIREAATFSGADTIVTTEKDAVKIADPGIVAVPIEFDIPDPVLRRILDTISR
ncbi:MAG: tetraacyldisaccharide 4'-kinase [Thermoanaerobaculia bacterium]